MITYSNSIFDDILDAFTYNKPSAYKPQFNTNLELEKDTDLFIKVPGCSRKDVQVEVDEKYISVTAKASVEGFDFGLEKKYIVPTNVDRDSLSAEVENGLLKIRLNRKNTNGKTKKLL